MKYFKKKSQLLIIALVVGFLFGILYVNMNIRRTGITIEILQRFFIEKFEKANVISERFFWYVVRTRLLSIATIILLGRLKWKRVGLTLWCGWTGFLFGILVVSSIVQMGIKGILVSVAGMFPHMFFYVPACVILFQYLYDYPRKQWNWTKTIFVFLTMLVGIVLESYINPSIMKLIVKMV